MSGFTDVFGGSTIQAAQVAYRAVPLTASITTFWPQFATANNYLARIMDVSPSAAGFTVSTPDATLATVGQDVFFNNRGLYAFTVVDFSGNVIAVVNPGAVRYIYLNDVTLPAGLWTSILFGAASSTLDASQLAGYGLTAINNTLAAASPTSLVGSNMVITSTSRGMVYVWTGGTGTFTLPGVASVGSNFFFEVRNQGTGVLTLQPASGELFDGSANAQLQLNESLTAHAGPAAWYSVGRGRNTQFNFTQLVKTVTGGTTTLTLTEAANVVQTYTGALTGPQIVILPAVVQVYYVSNATTNAFTFTFKNPTTGTTVTIPTGQSAVLFSDGVNVINSATTVAGISSLLLAAGSVTSPSLAIGTANSGLYAPGTSQVGVSAAGVQVAQFDSTGVKAVGLAAITLQAISATGQANIEADRLAGQIGRVGWRTAGIDRWGMDADISAESGSNVGSSLVLNAFSDTGALIGPVSSTARATRIVNYTFLPLAAGATLVNVSAAQTLTTKSIDGGTNTFTNIPAGSVTNIVSPLGFSSIVQSHTTAQRETGIGYLGYNTTLGQFEGYGASGWGSIGGGATGGGSDQVFNLNKPTVTVSYTLPAGFNANTVGPLILNTGVVVTVPTGARLVVL